MIARCLLHTSNQTLTDLKHRAPCHTRHAKCFSAGKHPSKAAAKTAYAPADKLVSPAAGVPAEAPN